MIAGKKGESLNQMALDDRYWVSFRVGPVPSGRAREKVGDGRRELALHVVYRQLDSDNRCGNPADVTQAIQAKSQRL